MYHLEPSNLTKEKQQRAVRLYRSLRRDEHSSSPTHVVNRRVTRQHIIYFNAVASPQHKAEAERILILKTDRACTETLPHALQDPPLPPPSATQAGRCFASQVKGATARRIGCTQRRATHAHSLSCVTFLYNFVNASRIQVRGQRMRNTTTI